MSIRGGTLASLNKVILIGNLGKDPELKYTPSGAAVCNFSLATTETWKSQDGTKQEKTEWHNIVVWRKQAEIAAEYLKKGKQICIEGKLQTRSWEADGQKRYMTEIVVDRFLMLGKKEGGDGGGYGGQSSSGSGPGRTDEQGGAPGNDSMQNDDDLPF